MSITGEAVSEPMKTGVALTDIITAHYAHGAISALENLDVHSPE